MKINIKSFLAAYNAEYEALYKNHIAGEQEAAAAFDEFCEKHGDFVGEFARYRGDYITSDREAAAFMFALEQFI